MAGCTVFYKAGDRHVSAKLTQAEVDALRKEHQKVRQGRSRLPQGWIAAQAKRLGVSYYSIDGICQGKGYTM
jgi:hypothetical protein